ncbi:Dimethylaniline monooxygenase [N-oxide-forming] 2 [Holothuria leucospilota]|uniref:Flavin-containing monooxygenase n=1 Tax=Holothuria leucospilota TaxID=206669 RepID=A0A9Q1C7U1_HOLLE|nr:Dimethylaniline monooxygenase [N-oxide-forming] 2 [Holothuria leucospilota]
MSLRSGFWLFKKNGWRGYPFDCYIHNRFNISFLPTWLQKYLYEGFFEMDTNYDALGIRPNRPIFRVNFGVSDFLLGQFMNGRVKTKPAVKRFFQNGVEFVDGTKLNDLDAVIFATGYTVTTPFIDDDLVPDDLDTRDLYKYVFPIRLPHSTLACIGSFSSDSSIPPITEMQSRWSVQVFKGTITLPTRSKMQEDITRKLKKQTEIFGKLKHFIPGISYSDELAKEIGCYPSIKKFLLTDPRLAFKLMYGPTMPSSYRLIGPHRWSGARKAVMNCWEDSLTGLSGKVVKKNDSYFRWLLVLGLFIIILAILY